MEKVWLPREAGVSLIDCDHRHLASDGGYPYVAIPQLKQGRLDLSNVRRIGQESTLLIGLAKQRRNITTSSFPVNATPARLRMFRQVSSALAKTSFCFEPTAQGYFRRFSVGSFAALNGGNKSELLSMLALYSTV